MTSNKKRKYGDIVDRKLPDSSSIVSQVFDRLIGRSSIIDSSPATSINMIEAIKSIEDSQSQAIEVNEATEIPKNDIPPESYESPKQDISISELFINNIETSNTIVSEPTSINMIEAIKSRDNIKLREDSQNQAINQITENSKAIEISKKTSSNEFYEIPKQDVFVSNIHTDKAETNSRVLNEPTSINMIEAINMSASIKEEAPPLSMGAAIKTSASINMIEVITVPTTKGETSIPNEIMDGLLPLLDPTASLVYLRLYRLSYGFRSEQCTVGMNKLASSVNIGVATAERAVRKLESVGLIERKGANFGHGIKGNHYIVRKPNTSINMREAIKSSDPINMREATIKSTSLNLRDNKDHDDDHDDLKKQDHHQSKHQKDVMMIYQKITGNNWTERDTASYKRIEKVPVEMVETTLRIANQRAASHPNSLSYFIKEILNAANPAPANRAQQKKKMQQIIERVLTSYVGSSNYTPSDVVYKVKEFCVKEDIPFDNDVFDDIMAKRKC